MDLAARKLVGTKMAAHTHTSNIQSAGAKTASHAQTAANIIPKWASPAGADLYLCLLMKSDSHLDHLFCAHGSLRTPDQFQDDLKRTCRALS